MTIHVGPRTISAIGGSIKRVGNYRIHTFPSELVTDGLVLNLDAGDPRSYPGSGTTWTDLSGNGRIGTITNATYINANGGNLVFANGSGTFVTVSNPPTFFSDYTLICWFYATSFGTNANGLISYGNEATSQRRALFLWDNGTGNLKVVSSTYSSNIFGNTTLALNTWYHAAVTVSSTGEAKIYLNGVLDGTGTNTLVTPASNTLYVGRTGTGEYFTGRIPSAQIYNRVLSAAEVAQNYDALKVRYTSYTNTFTPLCGGGSGKVEVLCVAGGGGGGNYFGGGGGAGGLLYNSAFTINSNVAIGVTVGAGGTGGFGNSNLSVYTSGTVGGNSIFSGLISYGGGVGNGYDTGGTQNGGSGGGGRIYNGTGGTGISGQGNAGGRGTHFNTTFPDDSRVGGGGGGAGGPGGISTVSSIQRGCGGPGLTYSISGNSLTYAGGGAGTGDSTGIPGSGIGGVGGANVGGNAYPNTGSGGGGSGNQTSSQGGNGSNGIVIVRYPATDYNVELLIVGGGGGGGGSTANNGGGGGGGAGGLIYYSSYPVSAGTKYTVTVGAGGTGQNATTGANGGNGNNSVFGSLVAFGGGGGCTGNGGGIANNGGSGGGGGYRVYTTVENGGFGVAGQGNNGSGVAASSAGGAGGGGAGSAGFPNDASYGVTGGGPGGSGLTYAITGSSVTYATGGQGGSASGTTGSANTGNGGAGTYAAANSNLGYAGGSGIIIIAYQGPQRGIGGTVDTTSRPGYTLHRFTTTGTDFFIP